MSFSRKDEFKPNHGIEGVVYILENPGLRAGYYKVGCTRHSGDRRADELNRAANTGMPGTYRCIFEHPTYDCGRAEEAVKKMLSSYARGKFGQEFFEIDLEDIKATILAQCARADIHVSRYAKEDKARQEWLEDKWLEKSESADTFNRYVPRPRRTYPRSYKSYYPKGPRWPWRAFSRLIKEWVWLAILAVFAIAYADQHSLLPDDAPIKKMHVHASAPVASSPVARPEELSEAEKQSIISACEPYRSSGAEPYEKCMVDLLAERRRQTNPTPED